MSTIPCHLELVDDLSTDHVVMSLERFIARRGRPQKMFSDNGTNFVGVNNELWKCLKQLNEQRIQNFCAPKEIDWNFQPPSAPHFGGAWERLVQCTKKTLKAVLKGRVVPKKAPRTSLVETEGILNSRPITHVSSDAGDILKHSLQTTYCFYLQIRVMKMPLLQIERLTPQSCGDSHANEHVQVLGRITLAVIPPWSEFFSVLV